MMQWKNNKGYTVRETERYIRTYFVDTKYNRIMLIEDKEDHDMDRINLDFFILKPQSNKNKKIFIKRLDNFIIA